MKAGVYKIVNRVNGKCYIGSSNNAKLRLYMHKRALKKNKHENIYLQAAWNKYGKNNFVFRVLFYCELDVLIEREQEMIDYYRMKNGKNYNLCPAAGSCLGFKHTEETKRKMMGNTNGRGRKGIKVSEETRLKQSLVHMGHKTGMTGKKHSEEARRKMSLAKKGKKTGRSWNKGLTKETNESILRRSLSLMGRKGPMLGKHHSDFTKKKISDSLRKGRFLSYHIDEFTLN
jgi:group I intron endonuclease